MTDAVLRSAAIEETDGLLPARQAVAVFLSFAFAYFFSALVRAVTATLAPQFSAELHLSAGDLGLLAGAYFSALPPCSCRSAARWTDSARDVCCWASWPWRWWVARLSRLREFFWLTLARGLIGVGVAACLMAPMTLFRRSFSPVTQMRANSWMLMTGSLGMVASTLPVQWLLPLLGWRGLFWVIAALVSISLLTIAWLVPRDGPKIQRPDKSSAGYAEVFRHPTFLRFAPLGFFLYGGLLAVQALWAGPWLVRICGWTPAQSAQGLFGINAAMLLAFLTWGVVLPRLYARGWTAQRLVTLGVPLSIASLLLAIVLGPRATAWVWGLFCVSCTFVSLSQPAIGQAFPAALAGRALSAYNLAIFSGVFALQWGIGLAIDRLRAIGWSDLSAFRGAFALFGLCCVLSYLWFLCRDDSAEPVEPKFRS